MSAKKKTATATPTVTPAPAAKKAAAAPTVVPAPAPAPAAPAGPIKRAAPIPPQMKLHVKAPGETYLFSQYVAALVAKYPDAEESVIKGVCMAVRSEVPYDVKDLTAKQKAALPALTTRVTKDFTKHKENKAAWDAAEVVRAAAAKAEKEKAKAEHDAVLAENNATMTNLMSSPAASKTLATVEKAANSLIVLSDRIKFDADGELVIPSDVTPADFQSAFATIMVGEQASGILKDRSAKAQAAVGFAAAEKLGDGWKQLFAGRKSEMESVQKGIKVFQTVKEGGPNAMKLFKALPLSTLRSVIEFKITTVENEVNADVAAAKNKQAKLDLLEQAWAKYEEQGSLTQTEAKNLATAYKNTNGVKKDAKVIMRFAHVFADSDNNLHVFGMPGPDADLDFVKKSLLSIDLASGKRMIWATDKIIDSQTIVGPTEAVLQYVRGKASGVAAPAAPAPAPAADLELEEEEVVIPPAASAPVAAKKPAKKVTPAPVAAPGAKAAIIDEEEEELTIPALPVASAGVLKAGAATTVVPDEEEEDEIQIPTTKEAPAVNRDDLDDGEETLEPEEV